MSSNILDDMRDVMRQRHYSIRTERSYCEWVKRFVLHFNMKSRDDRNSSACCQKICAVPGCAS